MSKSAKQLDLSDGFGASKQSKQSSNQLPPKLLAAAAEEGARGPLATSPRGQSASGEARFKEDGNDRNLVARLASMENMKLGKLLNQLQILGMDKQHLARLQAQLTEALGNDDDKQLRVLERAIQMIVKDQNYPPIPYVEKEKIKEWDAKKALELSKEATTYKTSGPSAWVQQGLWFGTEERESPRHVTTKRKDGGMVMTNGSMLPFDSALDESKAKRWERPMLSSTVTKASEDFIGDIQIDMKDHHSKRVVEKVVDEQTPQLDTTIASLTAFTAKKKKKLSAYAKLNEAVCHSHENQKSNEMKSIVFSEGRFTEDQEKLGPMPGTAFWKCFTICNVDNNRQGSDGGYRLEPRLQLPIPDSILMSNVGGIRLWGFYTDSDGFVCRTSVNKKSAAEWLSRRRRKRIAELSVRKPYRLKENEPLYVVRRSTSASNGCDVRPLLNDEALRTSLLDSSGSGFTLWQMYIRPQGSHAGINRFVLECGKEHENPHFIIRNTNEVAKPSSPLNGFFCESSNLKGTRASGRATTVHRVQTSAWSEQKAKFRDLIDFALHVFPFRRDKEGNSKQKYPKLLPKKYVIDFLVARDGSWWFSQVVVLLTARMPPNSLSLLSDKTAEGDEFLLSYDSLEQDMQQAIKASTFCMEKDNSTSRPVTSDLLQDTASELSDPLLQAPSSPAEPAPDKLSSTLTSRLDRYSAIGTIEAHALDTICRLRVKERTKLTGSRLLKSAIMHRTSLAMLASGRTQADKVERRIAALTLSHPSAHNPVCSVAFRSKLGLDVYHGRGGEQPLMSPSA
mmetsp:Transcript_11541/g.39808  ORF Transcript_11541/g.39808 Transcript_11541/m.39808 type:complete len:792 (-) Transcript_11541:1315-3690(-)